MIVGKRMSHPLLTISPDMPISEAISMMNTEKVRHLVVVEKNKLVGLVVWFQTFSATILLKTSSGL